MARSITEIQNQIIAAKEGRPELNRLSSTSKVAVWRAWAYITAVAINWHETLFDVFRDEVEKKIAAREAGTPPWYVGIVREFQAGDTLQVIDGKATYAVIDPAKQIVSRVSYKEVDSGSQIVLQLKVAKGGIGNEEPLTSSEQFQLKAYLERRKFAGVKIQIVSLNGDKLKLDAEVFFDGIYDPGVIKEAVINAIRNYMVSLDFDGLVYTNKIIDAIQKVEGVIDVKINSADVTVGVTTETIDRVYETAAGYIVEDETPGNTFEETITFTPQNV